MEMNNNQNNKFSNNINDNYINYNNNYNLYYNFNNDILQNQNNYLNSSSPSSNQIFSSPINNYNDDNQFNSYNNQQIYNNNSNFINYNNNNIFYKNNMNNNNNNDDSNENINTINIVSQHQSNNYNNNNNLNNISNNINLNNNEIINKKRKDVTSLIDRVEEYCDRDTEVDGDGDGDDDSLDFKNISNFTEYEQLIKSIKLTFYNENNLSSLKYSEEENVDVEYLYNSSLEKYKIGKLESQNHLIFILLIEKMIPFLKEITDSDITMVKKLFQTVITSIDSIEMNLSDATKDAGFTEKCVEFLCKFFLGSEQDLYFSIKCHQLSKEEKEKHYKRVLLNYQDTFKKHPNRFSDISFYKAMTVQHTRKALLYYKNSYVVKKISDAFIRIKNHKNGSIYGFNRLFHNCSCLEKFKKNEIDNQVANNWYKDIDCVKDFLSIKFKDKTTKILNSKSKYFVNDQDLLDFFEKCIFGFKAHYGKGVTKKKKRNNSSTNDLIISTNPTLNIDSVLYNNISFNNNLNNNAQLNKDNYIFVSNRKIINNNSTFNNFTSSNNNTDNIESQNINYNHSKFNSINNFDQFPIQQNYFNKNQFDNNNNNNNSDNNNTFPQQHLLIQQQIIHQQDLINNNSNNNFQQQRYW